MEGLSAELDFALKSRDPYPINLESLVDLLKYKHISSLTTHLKRHFQRDIDYKKFHQVRNKRQICVYYISVDCFKQICGFCRHTQRKEIAQNLLGNMSITADPAKPIAMNADEMMSFTDMLNDMNDLKGNDSSDEEDDIRMRQSSPPTKSIKIEKGSFVAKDTQNIFNKFGRTNLHSNNLTFRDHMKLNAFAEAPPATATNPPIGFSNNIYNFNNLSAATSTSTHSITPISPSGPITINKTSSLTAALTGTTFAPSSLAASVLANAAISNTNNSAFIGNNATGINNSFGPFTVLANNFANPNPYTPSFSNSTFANTFSNTTNFTPLTTISNANNNFTPSTTSISSFSSNTATHINPVTNINTITPFTSNPIPISITSTPTNNSTSATNFTATTTTNINNHKRSNSSRTSNTLPLTPHTRPITQVISTITPSTPISTPITPTPISNTTTATTTAPLSLTTFTTFTTFAAPTPTPLSPTTKALTPITPTSSTSKTPVPASPTMSKTSPTPPGTKSGVTKFFGFGNLAASGAKTGGFLNPCKATSDALDFKADTETSLFDDFGILSQPEMQYYNDYLTLSSSPTSMFDPVNTLAEVDKIYEQWELERGGPRSNTDWP